MEGIGLILNREEAVDLEDPTTSQSQSSIDSVGQPIAESIAVIEASSEQSVLDGLESCNEKAISIEGEVVYKV